MGKQHLQKMTKMTDAEKWLRKKGGCRAYTAVGQCVSAVEASRHGPTAHAASLTSLLPYLMPWEPRESTWESYDHGLLRASTPSKYSGPTGHRRSTFRCCCYSGAKSWAVLLIWAHSPPMVVYRTAIVEGLSIAHGRGEHCQFCPVKSEVISDTLTK